MSVERPNPGQGEASRRLKGLSLSGRFIALASSLVVATAVSIAAFVVHSENADEEEGLARRGLQIARMVAQNAEYAAYTEETASLEALLATAETDPDLDWVAVTSRDGRPLASRARGSSSATTGGRLTPLPSSRRTRPGGCEPPTAGSTSSSRPRSRPSPPGGPHHDRRPGFSGTCAWG